MTTAAVASNTPDSPGTQPDSSPAVVLGPVERTTAVVLIGLFVVFIGVLVALRDSAQWDRLVYLFGGFEALVFAAGGALFGTGIQRAQTVKAEQSAQRQEMRADANENDALHGRALAAMIRAKRRAGGADDEGRGARPQAGPVGGDTGMAELASVVEEWFPRK